MNSFIALLDWLIDTSLRASWLTISVLILQASLGHYISARWRYALWLPVLVVLLMPVFPESSWSVGAMMEIAPKSRPALPAVMQQGVALNTAAPILTADETDEEIPWSQIGAWVWLIGACGMICFSLASYLKTLRRIKHRLMPANDSLLTQVAALSAETGLRCVPSVWISPAIRGPAVAGFLRPLLLLPESFERSLSSHEARLVLRHELTHLKRGDLPLNALLCLLLAMHWFNPMLWLAFFKAQLDREAACDAQVLDQEPQSERVAYGHTLLKVESAFRHHGLSLGFVGIFQRGRALRSRILSIAKQPNQTLTMKMMLSFAIITLTFLGITKAAPADNNAPQVLIEAKLIEVGEEAKGLLAPFAGKGTLPSLGGVLSNEQFSAVWQKIETAQGVDVFSTPRVSAISGHEAQIDMGREFAYMDARGKPTKKQIGTQLELLPKVIGKNQIELNVSPQVVDFEGFVKHESGFQQPIFRERKSSINVSLTSGQTIVFDLSSTLTKLTLEDPDAGHIRTKTLGVPRHSMLFLTAHLVEDSTREPIDRQSAPLKGSLQAKLDAIILPRVVFTDAKVSEAVKFLRSKSFDLDATTKDPKQKGVNITVEPTEDAETFITLNLKDISLGEALNYVARLSNLRLLVDDYSVTLLSQTDFATRQKQTKVLVSGSQDLGLTSKSISHDKDSGVIAQEGDLKNQTFLSNISGEKVAIKPNTTADGIIIPEVQFHDATLAEAVEFLRVKSREVDPKSRGLNILIRPGVDSKTKISMHLKEVPVQEVLRYLVTLAGCMMKKEGDVFVITSVQGDR
jgi:beta-lactamase regulating signal transducer with metallopeptidase domain